MLRVGLIGFGAIGQGIAELVESDHAGPICLVGAMVRSAQNHQTSFPLTELIEELLALSPDVIAEAAGHEALRRYGPICLRAGVPLAILSVGALADAAFESELRDAARDSGTVATVVSGAIGGLDLIASAAAGGLTSVRHTITKPPKALGLSASEGGEVFRGSAREAAKRYPQNANVAAAVALAGIGLDRSVVVVEADPSVDRNRHKIEISGVFGDATFTIAGRPSAANPATGALVAMSLKHHLEKRDSSIVIG